MNETPEASTPDVSKGQVQNWDAAASDQKDFTALLIGTLECPICGGKHDRVPATEYTSPFQEYTHWYVCPTTGGPVPFWIENREIQTPVNPGPAGDIQGDLGPQAPSESQPLDSKVAEAVTLLMGKIDELMLSGRWFVSIHWIDSETEDRTNHFHQTHNFGTGRFVPCLNKLTAYIESQTQPLKMKPPEEYEAPKQTGMPS